MKKGIKGTMNVDFSESYDQEDDIYYVTFKTGEPSYVIEVDDRLLLEVGMFTNMPTGFRILNFKKSKINGVILVKKVKKTLEETFRKVPSDLRLRETQVEQTLEKVLA